MNVIFVIDIGNTQMVMGVYREKQLLTSWRISTNKTSTSDEYAMLVVQLFQNSGLDWRDVSGIIISSVVPSINYTIEHMCRRYFHMDPLLVGPGIKTGLNIRYDNPREVGADRIVNAIAAIDQYGGPCIIVDMGTATTFCAISEKNEYMGGVIIAGLRMSTEALTDRAARLPRIELEKPPTVIGRNTVHSMQSGAIYGYVGQVDYIVRRMKKEMNAPNARVVATGGLSRLIASESEMIQEVNGLLTLEGLRLLYERNKPEKKEEEIRE